MIEHLYYGVRLFSFNAKFNLRPVTFVPIRLNKNICCICLYHHQKHLSLIPKSRSLESVKKEYEYVKCPPKYII